MNPFVPYSSIKEFEKGFKDQWMKRVEAITNETQFVGGAWISKLEERLAKDAQTQHAVLCANGTDAIQLVLRAMGIGPGDRVLVPDFTFWATFEAVCNVGASPVTLDIQKETFHISSEMVKLGIEKYQPKAIILVHLFGWACADTKEIREICLKSGVKLIEDSAQAWGVEIDGEPLLKSAPASTVSFYPGKVLGAAGDGGAVLTNDSELAEKVRLLANHGRKGKYEHFLVGWNSRMDNLQAAYVELSLDFISQRMNSRRKAINWYKDNIKSKKIKFHSPAKGIIENGYISVAELEPDLRKKLEVTLTESKIGFGIVYPGSISGQPGAQTFLAGKISHKNADTMSQRVLNLPCFAGITEQQLKQVADAVERGLR